VVAQEDYLSCYLCLWRLAQTYIPAEISKSLGEKAFEGINPALQRYIQNAKGPEDFLQTILIPLKKKANVVRCKEYRTISLLTHGHGGALVESIAFNRRVVGSTPALAAM